MSNAPESTEVLVERVRFDIIGITDSGHELSAWTDGDRIVWQDDEGRSGYMPAMLFRAAAHALAAYCEEEAMGGNEASGQEYEEFVDATEDSSTTPVSLAMSHPYWKDPDDERNSLRFGFNSLCVNVCKDVQPSGLKERKR